MYTAPGRHQLSKLDAILILQGGCDAVRIDSGHSDLVGKLS